MIVPDYWAEARKQHRASGKQVTVRKFGWSIVSQEDAQAMAEQRTGEALERLLSGEALDRREPKTAYNGAAGVPIREEVLARYGEEVITRNSYGAHCLNSPRTLIADVDYSLEPSRRALVITFALLAIAPVVFAAVTQRWGFLPIVIGALLFMRPLARLGRRMAVAYQGGHERLVQERIRAFVRDHQDWNVRLYRTPGGLRALVTHQAFQSSDQLVQAFFTAVGADPLYVRMCNNQGCFRARLTAKPWRIGIAAHMRPRPGLWPVHPDRLPRRQQWVLHYERVAAGFAACHFIDSIGSGTVHADVAEVIALHDRESRATNLSLPIA